MGQKRFTSQASKLMMAPLLINNSAPSNFNTDLGPDSTSIKFTWNIIWTFPATSCMFLNFV